DRTLPAPDWRIFGFPGLEWDLSRTHPFTPELLEASRFLSREGLAPLLDRWPSANSDFFPVLDLGAERTRFLQLPASGFLQSAAGPFDAADAFLPDPLPDGGSLHTPVPQIPMGKALILRNRVRSALAPPPDRRHAVPEGGEGPGASPGVDGDLELRQALYRAQLSGALLAIPDAPADWNAWLRQVLEGGGWDSPTGWRFLNAGFLARVEGAALRLDAPAGVLSAVAFLRALEVRDWGSLVSASDALAAEIAAGRRWINPAVVLDAGVLARIFSGDPGGALDFFGRLEPLAGRSPEDFRSRLIEAHLDQALSGR
ncbi:MAG: hypothetical protein ACWGSQ_14615, partial [Longimicrobiales bacterium]